MRVRGQAAGQREAARPLDPPGGLQVNHLDLEPTPGAMLDL
ncbi:hypothetical protein [Sphaerisporangium album]|nr:hypothetical protein [Sphaerisporangium album]